MADLNLTHLDPEVRHHLSKIASPAHLAQYVTRNFPHDSEAKWSPYRHHLYMNDLLVEAFTDPVRTFLNMSVSVRMGKTMLCTQYAPVWYLGMYPDRSVMLISHSARKAEQWGAFTMNVMKEFGPELFGLQVDPDNNSRGSWGLKGRKGTMRAVGIGTAIEGEGIHLGVIDDPLDPEAAASPAQLESAWDWYTDAFRPRLMPSSTTLLVMSRWGLLDIAGRIEEHQAKVPGSDPWVTVRLPAIAEAPVGAGPEWRDELGRKSGESLWPERWPAEDLEQIRLSIPPATWESRYQQNPTAREGDMFKVASWKRVPSVDRSTLRMARAWDLAASKGKGDWTVGVLMGIDSHNRIFVLDVQRVQEDSLGVKRLIQAMAELDGRHVPVLFEQEKAGAGKAQVADFKRMLLGWVVEGVRPEGTKAQRAAPYASQQQDGNVYLVEAAWNDAYIEEHRPFGPEGKGRHDDQVDASSLAFSHLSAAGPVSAIMDEIQELDMDRMLNLSLARSGGPF